VAIIADSRFASHAGYLGIPAWSGLDRQTPDRHALRRDHAPQRRGIPWPPTA